MNHDDQTEDDLNLSQHLERDINGLSQIFTAMRALELTHVIDPRDRDPADYKMLVDDMTATLRHLTRTLLAAKHQGSHPVVVSTHDFPPDGAIPIGEVTPRQTIKHPSTAPAPGTRQQGTKPPT
ncbi:hypothetical protein ACGFNU_44185 [Spirillospora sp. NPDC048911]|uniref:hypothetical protein n=1 Tax=Spirillospora sp. NPDC048911 TaxID=3364527 RepID=UPI00371A31CE